MKSVSDMAGNEGGLLLESPDLVAALAAAIQPRPDDLQRLQHMRARLLASAAQEPFHVVRSDAQDFLPLMPGIAIRSLRVDTQARTQTSLWRIAPGACIPRHAHAAEEECLVLEGDVEWDGVRYGVGDYLLARPGAEHAPFVSPSGALLMIRSELTPELARAFRIG